MFRRCLSVLLVFTVTVLPLQARGQVDDLLAPLTPPPAKAQPERRPKAKAKKRPSAPKAVRSEHAKLMVVPSPSDAPARLFVDGVDKGLIPNNQPLELAPGSHTVEVRRLGFANFTQSMDLAPNDSRQVLAELVAVSAVVNVETNVPGAEVWVDGVRAGTAPLRSVLLTPGGHALVIRKSGHKDESSQLQVKAGREYTIQATLRPGSMGSEPVAKKTDAPLASSRLSSDDVAPRTIIAQPEVSDRAMTSPLTQLDRPVHAPKPIYKRWYFWAGVGAAALAAGIGTYALTSGNDASRFCNGPCAATLNE